MHSLLKMFENIIVLDVETTGIDHKGDEIIELAALRVESRGAEGEIADDFDYFVRLSPGRRLPEFITNLTGITETQLEQEGVSKAAAAERIAGMLSCSKPLVVAYNAQFDLCFLYYLLAREGRADALRNIKMLDALTVYKDRRPYPHKLADAVEAYALQAQNTHRAIDDARAALELLYAMEEEWDDLPRYINLFGYNPRYGVSGPRISSIRYLPQPYDAAEKLYDT